MVTVKTASIVAQLRALYQDKEDAQYRQFFDWAATAQRNRWATTIDNICKAFEDGDRSDAKILADKMEEIGVGLYKVGRRGGKSRVEWRFRIDSVGQVARGDSTDLLEKGMTPEDEDENADETDGFLSHRFRLRLDETITINLPADLTQSEADRLANFVRTLPFE
ncbi:hypothetical protein OGR47_13460 [Methylocystis sp. MJC1]|uniref:hypothetical protein n=1 Tax=Methylocystis sp. MJC1 TaxID=2654282 RepID=UPI0013ED9D7C|nr:hypothetical protein [Methylocystis sp. MJC1]KAF2989430.1 hypothetical protein MJC1_03404 [Methylocystis sp. MJC1]MBU6527978.1 hypothetical protein [Methylocystis sp. MJC1]UZX13830.1 hypothetical protein OGR47_13460 [Methylocystis sp. MJC1]